MKQVWILDNNNFWTGESTFVEEVSKGMTDTPLINAFIKSKFISGKWVEGATDEEIQAWKDSQQIDICTGPTVDERLEEAEQENKILKAQVEALSSNQDFYEDCIAEMAALVYA